MSSKRDEYVAKFRDPRWQKVRLEVMQRDDFTCQLCFDKETTLNVHHRYYENGKDPWDYPLEALLTLCETCHEAETEMLREMKPLLIRDLCKLFSADDIRELAWGFNSMRLVHIPEVVASAISWALRNSDFQQEMVERYLATLTQARRERIAADANRKGCSEP